MSHLFAVPFTTDLRNMRLEYRQIRYFGLQEKTTEVTNNLKKFNNPFVKAKITSAIFQSLNEIQTSATNIIAKVNDIMKV